MCHRLAGARQTTWTATSFEFKAFPSCFLLSFNFRGFHKTFYSRVIGKRGQALKPNGQRNKNKPTTELGLHQQPAQLGPSERKSPSAPGTLPRLLVCKACVVCGLCFARQTASLTQSCACISTAVLLEFFQEFLKFCLRYRRICAPPRARPLTPRGDPHQPPHDGGSRSL